MKVVSIAAAAAHQRKAITDDFHEFYQIYSEAVYRTALRVTGNPVDAEDVLQNVFLRFLNRRIDIPTVRQEPICAAWPQTPPSISCASKPPNLKPNWKKKGTKALQEIPPFSRKCCEGHWRSFRHKTRSFSFFVTWKAIPMKNSPVSSKWNEGP
jgi:hypothetical protein